MNRSREKEGFFALDAGESEDVLDFHILCLQGSHKSWAVKQFTGPALKCIRGFCTHSCKQ